MKIQKLTVAELADWVESEVYSQLPIVPISRERALSFLHNPRSLPSDTICYLAWKGEELMGFRTLLVDYYYTDTSFKKFAWLSGVWVAPAYRREGIATVLLKALWEDWEGRLMVANMSPAARTLCMNSGLFQSYYVKPGKRYYVRFAFHQLLAPRHRVFRQLSGFIKVGDHILNVFNDRKLLIQRSRISDGEIPYKVLPKLDTEWISFLQNTPDTSLTRRGPKELQWMQDFPWVKKAKYSPPNQQNYPFTHIENAYQEMNLGIYDLNNNPRALMIFLRVGRHMTIPYLLGENLNTLEPEFWENVRTLILFYLIHWKCDMLTVYHRHLVSILDRTKGAFLYKKPFEETYLASSSLLPDLPNPEHLIWQDGEGDAGFTN